VTAASLPHGFRPADYDPFMAEVVDGDPYPVYARLRETAPRLYLERYDAWFFSTFEDVWNLTRSRSLSVAQGITPSQLLLGVPPNNFMPSQMDPPEHTAFRVMLNDLVKPAAARALESLVRERARQYIVALKARGGGDVMSELGSPLAAEVGCNLSGIPSAEVPQLVRWNNQFFHRQPDRRGDTDVGAAAYAEIMAFVWDLVRAAKSGRHTPGGGLAAMLEAQRSNPAITDEHVAYTVFNLQIAAGDTVPKGIAASLHRLWANPGEWALLRSDPSLAMAAFTEAVRLDMPTQMQGRTAVATIELGDVAIRPGQKAMFLFAAANRDGAEFEAPDEYRIVRKSRRQLAFGNDIHRCLGVHVAQMEGRIALEEVVAALPGYEIDLGASGHHRTEYLKGWAHLALKC
jgi:cytochrome P450